MQPPHGSRLLPNDRKSLPSHTKKRHFRAKKAIAPHFPENA